MIEYECTCETCKYRMHMEERVYFCVNEDSDNYGCHVEYSDSCEEWEER